MNTHNVNCSRLRPLSPSQRVVNCNAAHVSYQSYDVSRDVSPGNISRGQSVEEGLKDLARNGGLQLFVDAMLILRQSEHQKGGGSIDDNVQRRVRREHNVWFEVV